MISHEPTPPTTGPIGGNNLRPQTPLEQVHNTFPGITEASAERLALVDNDSGLHFGNFPQERNMGGIGAMATGTEADDRAPHTDASVRFSHLAGGRNEVTFSSGPRESIPYLHGTMEESRAVAIRGFVVEGLHNSESTVLRSPSVRIGTRDGQGDASASYGKIFYKNNSGGVCVVEVATSYKLDERGIETEMTGFTISRRPASEVGPGNEVQQYKQGMAARSAMHAAGVEKP